MRLAIRGMSSALAGPFDLEVAAGACIAISGASGSGKSLFLRMIADLDPHEGQITLDDVSQAAVPAPQWRRSAVYVAAESAWWLERAIDHLPPALAVDARAMAVRLGVGARQMDGPVSLLSTGERQRLSLVRGLVMQPPLLLLDEPTGPLDPVATEAVETELRTLMTAGTAVIMVTHEAAQAGRMGAAHYIMADRRLRAAA
jgi:putative ABC transport system ATP-binding protein